MIFELTLRSNISSNKKKKHSSLAILDKQRRICTLFLFFILLLENISNIISPHQKFKKLKKRFPALTRKKKKEKTSVPDVDLINFFLN